MAMKGQKKRRQGQQTLVRRADPIVAAVYELMEDCVCRLVTAAENGVSELASELEETAERIMLLRSRIVGRTGVARRATTRYPAPGDGCDNPLCPTHGALVRARQAAANAAALDCRTNTQEVIMFTARGSDAQN